MSADMMCRRCHEELVWIPNEYGSGSKYRCPVCHREYDSNTMNDEPLTFRAWIALLICLFIPVASIVFAHYCLSVMQAAVFILILFIILPGLLLYLVNTSKYQNL